MPLRSPAHSDNLPLRPAETPRGAGSPPGKTGSPPRTASAPGGLGRAGRGGTEAGEAPSERGRKRLPPDPPKVDRNPASRGPSQPRPFKAAAGSAQRPEPPPRRPGGTKPSARGRARGPPPGAATRPAGRRGEGDHPSSALPAADRSDESPKLVGGRRGGRCPRFRPRGRRALPRGVGAAGGWAPASGATPACAARPLRTPGGPRPAAPPPKKRGHSPEEKLD